MLKRIFLFFTCFFLIINYDNFAARIRQSYGGSLSKLKKLKTAPFLINKLTFNSDVNLSREEFLYLTELQEDHFVKIANINRAYKNLMNKNRFSIIDIDLFQTEEGNHLHFTLKGTWVLKKVQIKGIVFDKQQYLTLYAQQPGETFDSSLHEESIKNIRSFLHDQGYFANTVSDELEYAKTYKTITASLSIKKNTRFLINTIKVKISNEKKIPLAEISKLEQLITNRLGRTILKVKYSKHLIKKQSKRIKALLAAKDFIGSRIFMNKTVNKENKIVDLVFTIKLGKRKTLYFEGNQLFSTNEIKKDILGLDQPDWLFAPDIIAEQIIHEYYKKGYWESTITYAKDEQDRTTFFINEGKPVLVDNIEVIDVDTQLPEETSFFWTSLLKTKILDQTSLDEGIDKLKNFYISEGYWDFKIIEKKFSKQFDTNAYLIRLLINKGKQHFWGGFSIVEYPDLATADFFKKYLITNTRDLIPFNNNWLKEQKVALLNYFQRLGYWYVSIQPTLQMMALSEEASTQAAGKNNVKVFVDWHIDPGPQVTFGKILLQGNTRLPFTRIMKEIKFKEGEAWDKEKLELTRKRLKRLDVFKQVQIQPFQLSKHKSKKPVIVNLIDDDPLEIRLRAGYFLTSKNFLFKRQSTPKIGASLIVKNPTNRADKFILDTDITRFERKLDLSYQQPGFMGLPGMGKLKGFTHKYVHPVQIGSSSSAYEASQSGFLVGLHDEYRDCYHWGLSVGNEWTKTSRVRGNLNFDPDFIDRTLPYFFIEPTLVIDKLNDRINTTQGRLTFFSLKFMIPESKGDITARLMLEQSFFYPLYQDFVLALRMRLGYIFRRKFEHIMPIERFYLGGPYSVRGYEKDAVPPLGISERIDDSGNSVKEYTIQGGSSMINTNLELRFPLYDKLGGVVFQDLGILSQSGLNGFLNKWYPSSGFGLRYKTPIGAIRFDIGWKWQKRLEGDSPYVWYLTLGEAF